MIPIDKIYHFIAGIVITLIVGFTFNPLYGVIAGFSAGLGKELYDRYKYGGFDFFDFFVTLLGVFLGGAIIVGYTSILT